MTELRSYKSPQDFLKDAGDFLMEREVVNNLILGICAEENRSEDANDLHFAAVLHDKKVMIAGLVSRQRLIIAAITYQKSDLKKFADHYMALGVKITGIIGETLYAEMLSEIFGQLNPAKNPMLVFELKKLQPCNYPVVSFKLAQPEQIEQLVRYQGNYYLELPHLPKLAPDAIIEIIRNQVKNEELYVVEAGDQPVSMAAVLRRTKNYAIIGNVYTPKQFRKHGYATACVHQLVKTMLDKGLEGCGLFADSDVAGPIAIYKAIGFKPVAEFTSLIFS